MFAVSQERLDEAEDNVKLYHQRFMLHTFIGLMAYAGMRPLEALKLTWKDISETETDGKTYWKITEYHTKNDLDCDQVVLSDARQIFINYDGHHIKSFARGFKSLMIDADLYTGTMTGKSRDAYCLRHWYATERLLAGISVYTLAENTGTSVQMIQQHYGHLRPEMAAAELTKGRGG